MPVKHLKDLDEFNELLKSPGLVVVDFSASWCGPCKFIAPKFEELSNTYSTVSFAKVDDDEASDITENQNISAFPTFKFYKGGAVVGELMGADEKKLKELLETHSK